jgi:hypothetical protein
MKNTEQMSWEWEIPGRCPVGVVKVHTGLPEDCGDIEISFKVTNK